jgi:uncharacterized cupredoxin-like copper-binding protein
MNNVTGFVKSHPRAFKILVVVILLVAAFAGGRQFGPTKVVTVTETKTETQYVDKVQYVDKIQTVYVHDVAKDVHSVTVVEKKPDGTETTTVTVDDKSKSETSASSQEVVTKDEEKTKDTESDTKSTKVVENYKPQWHLGLRLGAGGGFDAGKPPALLLSAGLQAERRILGPVFMGLWADVHANAMPFGTAPYTVVGGLSVSLEL